jgi:hypothetical protein
MESWRKVWREGIVPLLDMDELVALRNGLLCDDPQLIQGSTCQPPPLQCVQEWDCEGACALGYIGWKADGLQMVGEVEEFFAKMCYEIDLNIDEPAGCRHFLNWFDETPREEMRKLLLEEVGLAITNMKSM